MGLFAQVFDDFVGLFGADFDAFLALFGVEDCDLLTTDPLEAALEAEVEGREG